jgi:hypothetical protein
MNNEEFEGTDSEKKIEFLKFYTNIGIFISLFWLSMLYLFTSDEKYYVSNEKCENLLDAALVFRNYYIFMSVVFILQYLFKMINIHSLIQ